MNRNIIIGTSAVLTAALGIGLYSYFSISKSRHPLSPLSLQMTARILKQVKHQMLITCVSFAEGMNKHLKQNIPEDQQEQLDNYFRKELTKIYETKEESVLMKYEIRRNEYAQGLKNYASNAEIARNTAEIFDMLERALRGELPNLTVPIEMQTRFKPTQLKDIYISVCLKIAGLVLHQIRKMVRQDNNFDPKDDICFRRGIKDIKIYDVKVEYFRSRGIDPIDRCPNEVFFKLLEREKQRVPAYKAEMQAIEKGYETIIEKITQNPNGIQEEDFPAYLMKNVESEEKIPFPSEPKKESVRMPVPAIARSLPTQIEPKKPVPKKEQEPDLQALMLSELLQRNIQGDSRKGSEYFEPQKKVDSVLKKEKQEKSNSKVEEIHTENVQKEKVQQFQPKNIETVQQENIAQGQPENIAQVQPQKIQGEKIQQAQPQNTSVEKVQQPQETNQVEKVQQNIIEQPTSAIKQPQIQSNPVLDSVNQSQSQQKPVINVKIQLDANVGQVVNNEQVSEIQAEPPVPIVPIIHEPLHVEEVKTESINKPQKDEPPEHQTHSPQENNGITADSEQTQSEPSTEKVQNNEPIDDGGVVTHKVQVVRKRTIKKVRQSDDSSQPHEESFEQNGNSP